VVNEAQTTGAEAGVSVCGRKAGKRSAGQTTRRKEDKEKAQKGEYTMPQEQPTREETMQKRRDFAPKLMELNERVLFGDIWERSGLSKRDRSLITVATLVALYRINELPFHIARARENGISKDELAELFTHLAFYAGWPSAMTAVNIAMEVLAESE
jgi:4-carboxymuconolactone decarboxylase